MQVHSRGNPDQLKGAQVNSTESKTTQELSNEFTQTQKTLGDFRQFQHYFGSSRDCIVIGEEILCDASQPGQIPKHSRTTCALQRQRAVRWGAHVQMPSL